MQVVLPTPPTYPATLASLSFPLLIHHEPSSFLSVQKIYLQRSELPICKWYYLNLLHTLASLSSSLSPTILVLSGERVTAVKFQQVHLPVGKSLGVHLQVVLAAWIPSAGFSAKVLVDAQLQSLGVHLVKWWKVLSCRR